jgi:hypothetical protein
MTIPAHLRSSHGGVRAGAGRPKKGIKIPHGQTQLSFDGTITQRDTASRPPALPRGREEANIEQENNEDSHNNGSTIETERQCNFLWLLLLEPI